MIKVRAHTCYLGSTGYAAHARSFFRELSNHVDLRVRNFTWDGSPDYLNDTDRQVLDTITLTVGDGKREDFHISRSFPAEKWATTPTDASAFVPDVDIVLMEGDHLYFYEEYTAATKIAYTVWESTLIPDNFFRRLLQFDYLWVATQWHYERVVAQGYPAHRVYVVNEGVDPAFCKDTHGPLPTEYADRRFKFLFFGRWDYRKSVPEIIRAFLTAFPNNEPVDLVLSADNPYAVDGLQTTEERLENWGFVDPRIRVKHFVSRTEYEAYVKKGHVMITCARSEGWNIPLLEAMAAGTPAIYSGYGAQLEFAAGKGNPVRISGMVPADAGAHLSFAGAAPGDYAEPDYGHLVEVLQDCYVNYADKKSQALAERAELQQRFDWRRVATDAAAVLEVTTLRSSYAAPHKAEAAIVVSHAETPEKRTLLKRCIHNLKIQGYYVIVSSHIAIEEAACSMSDYVVIETDNPLITVDDWDTYQNHPIWWWETGAFRIEHLFAFNHSLAALRLIQAGLAVVQQKGYAVAHIVNYDYVLEDPQTLATHSELLLSADVVGYPHHNGACFSLNTGLLSVKAAKFSDSIGLFQTKGEYLATPGLCVLEDWVHDRLAKSSVSVSGRDHAELQKIKANLVAVDSIGGSVTAAKDIYIKLVKESDRGETYLFCDAPTGITGFRITVDGVEHVVNKNRVLAEITEEMLAAGIDVCAIPRPAETTTRIDKASRTAAIAFKEGGRTHIEKLCVHAVQRLPNVHFVGGPFIEIPGLGSDYAACVQFIDAANDEIVYETKIGSNQWARCHRKYYTDWKIRITDTNSGKVSEVRMDLEGKRVFISIESDSLGDNLGWMPYIEEFRLRHKCKVIASTFRNELFASQYPDIVFVAPGQAVENLYASYAIGWFYENGSPDVSRNPTDFKPQPMQKTASDVLGLPYQQVRPRITTAVGPPPIETPYVCIAIHSTAQAKYWNNSTGWQEVVDWLIAKGYTVVAISREGDAYMGNRQPTGIEFATGPQTLENAMLYLQHAKAFIGLSSGLSWLSWAVGTPTVIISGFSSPSTEMVESNVLRIFNPDSCNSCFNRVRLDAGDWNWCPDQKGTPRQFECSKSITGSAVIQKLEPFMADCGYSDCAAEKAVQESYGLGMTQNHTEILEAAKFFADLNVENFIEIGTDRGGTFALWSKLSADGMRISVDLPHGAWSHAGYDVNQRDERLRSLGSDVTMIHGDSRSPAVLTAIENKLNGLLVDFIFIDGDHSYEGVKGDYELYKRLVKPGGWIGFHDVKNTEFHRIANCRVDQLWDELEGNKIEFIDRSSDFGGIGFIQVPAD